jgi:dihydrofolate reductase
VRKVVMYMLTSLDGAVDHPNQYFTPDQSPSGVPHFDSVMAANEATIIDAQDAVLLGRTMYDEWSQFWPTADEEPFADFINNVRKYVVTSTPLTSAWHNAEAIHRPVEDLVTDLKGRTGGDIGVHGSVSLAESLLEAGLVDELQLVVGPVLGFTGRRLFAGTDHIRRLELLSAAPTPSGSLLLGYRVRPDARAPGGSAASSDS